MKLFHEFENKYFELLSYLVNGDDDYSKKEIASLCDTYLQDSRDYAVEGALFDRTNSTVFESYGDKYVRVLPCHFPVRNTRIELQAVRELGEMIYAHHFLAPMTIKKLQGLSSDIPVEWSMDSIQIQNQYIDGIKSSDVVYEQTLRTIIEAVNGSKNIIYDNVVPGKYEFNNKSIFPVKIEYSFINDVFRICGYDPVEDRFIKMNLASLSNVRVGDEHVDKLQDEYREYLELNMKKVVLDVEPSTNVIERCFRIFSYYERIARFDKDSNHYTLEISYLKADEAEVIRDILSLGGWVIVTEPRRIQKEVYKRIVMAREKYKA